MYRTLLGVGLGALILWIVIFLLNRYYDLESHGVSLNPGVLTWRTKHGLGVLDKIARSGKRFWKIFGGFGGIAGIFLMGVMFALLILNAVFLSTQGPPPGMEGPGVVPALPGITIPFTAGVIAIVIVLLTHEPAHGIMARIMDIDIKSTGLALFLIIPGAFVEEDEEEFENSSSWSRIQVAGAGPFANLVLGIISFFLILGLITPLSGLYVWDTLENSPANQVGLQSGSRLMAIDDVEIGSYSDFRSFLDNARPGQEVTLYTSEGQYTINLANENGHAFVGVSIIPNTASSRGDLIGPIGIYSVAFTEIYASFQQGVPLINHYLYDSAIPWYLLNLLKWIFTLNLLVALFNLLPLKPLDGGHIIQGLSEKITTKENANTIANGFSLITLTVILIAAVLPML
ncbi:hypothetical protein AKJ50_00850 [candidate division MSBL1 archaeon SCGC-AAA382A13]|uniref:Peptidase M50 domain-containing protein n=1 Tax=candidate division MSBL1 archaeon SCGC-AAA382A13 TaxID=1698279 RepID=A0A133VGC5_9EURY|nr:hypothetical protein AKJ50_00850 [candidate division MSBL1 archaeon SCGC-AAA382A13]